MNLPERQYDYPPVLITRPEAEDLPVGLILHDGSPTDLAGRDSLESLPTRCRRMEGTWSTHRRGTVSRRSTACGTRTPPDRFSTRRHVPQGGTLSHWYRAVDLETCLSISGLAFATATTSANLSGEPGVGRSPALDRRVVHSRSGDRGLIRLLARVPRHASRCRGADLTCSLVTATRRSSGPIWMPPKGTKAKCRSIKPSFTVANCGSSVSTST